MRAEIKIAGRAVNSVRLLDPDGRATQTTILVADGAFKIGGARDKSFYYEVRFK